MLFDPRDRKENRSSRIGMALFRLSQAVKKVTQADSDAVGFSPVQVQALLFCLHTRADAATVGHFADVIGTTHVTAVKTINVLADKGLIVKAHKPEDRRVTLLRLTPKGEEEAAKLERWAASISALMSAMRQRHIIAGSCNLICLTNLP
ncbi:MarR family winged helix-turn-helix transcriptional regulator [Paenibacillus sp. GYB003]|uniref:MarR family winged helix-turn-helix transcriptional regulator n=1 Tax=Paenibacillus sp. GYB003 TaxID=2994392 RepID=UPI002F968C9B